MKNFTTEAASFLRYNRNGCLWGFGAHWESNAKSEMLGTLYNSSLLLNEERWNINAGATEQIRSGNWKYINQIYVAAIHAATQEYNNNYAKNRVKHE